MHIDGNNRAFLVLFAAQCVRDVGSAAIRNQRHVVRFRSLDKRRDLILGSRIHDQIGNAAKPRVLDRVHLFLRMAMSVSHPDFTARVDLRRVQELLDRGEKIRVDT